MESVVRLLDGVEVAAGHRVLILGVDRLERDDALLRRRQRDAQRGVALEDLADLVDLADLLDAEPADGDALVALLDHDADPLEPRQGLADLVAGRPRPLGGPPLPQALGRAPP